MYEYQMNIPTTHRSCDDDAVKTVSYWFCFAFGSNLGHSSVSTFEPVGSLQLQCRISSSFISSTSYMEDSVGDMSLLVTDSNWHPFDSLSVTCHIVPGEDCGPNKWWFPVFQHRRRSTADYNSHFRKKVYVMNVCVVHLIDVLRLS